MQRPHLARRCPGLGWPSPVTLKPQPGHSRLQRNFSRVPADHPLQTAALLPRRQRGMHGRDGHLVEGGDLLPGQLLAGLGPAQQQVSVGHVPPSLSLPWAGSRNPLLRRFCLLLADAAAASASARRSPAPPSAPRTPGRPGGWRSAGLTWESSSGHRRIWQLETRCPRSGRLCWSQTHGMPDAAAAWAGNGAWTPQVLREVHISDAPVHHCTQAPGAGESPPRPTGLSAVSRAARRWATKCSG